MRITTTKRVAQGDEHFSTKRFSQTYKAQLLGEIKSANLKVTSLFVFVISSFKFNVILTILSQFSCCIQIVCCKLIS